MTFHDRDTSWFLAQLKPNCANIADKNLKRQGFQTFLPMEEETRQRNGKFVTAMRPLFPGYIIKGTRITCRSVKGRVYAGDTLDDLVEDYDGEIPKEVFEVALTYANSHPARGRPGAGKPWR